MTIAGVRHLNEVVQIVLVLAGLLCCVGGAYRAWQRDFLAAAVLVVIGIVLLVIAA